MTKLTTLILNELKKIDISRKQIKSENQFEDFVFEKLDNFLRKYNRSILLKRQQTSNRETRQLKPDITIGLNEILIELKYDIKNLNDIYRLFYQAVKYSRIAKELLILFLYDPQKKLSREDIGDLESCKNVKVVRII